MKQIWIHRARSFKDAQEFDVDYYQSLTPAERVAVVQYLRELEPKFRRNSARANAEKDFEKLLRLFNKHRVRYCIVGAFAVAFHALRHTYTHSIHPGPKGRNELRVHV